MIGREYVWRGRRWRVVCRWAGAGPRNILIEDVKTGRRVVRPFRGLRKPAVIE